MSMAILKLSHGSRRRWVDEDDSRVTILDGALSRAKLLTQLPSPRSLTDPRQGQECKYPWLNVDSATSAMGEMQTCLVISGRP